MASRPGARREPLLKPEWRWKRSPVWRSPCSPSTTCAKRSTKGCESRTSNSWRKRSVHQSSAVTEQWSNGVMEHDQHSNTPSLQHSNSVVVGIITISDRASGGEYEDLGGPALQKVAAASGWQLLAEAIVPDDSKRIQETIRSFAQQGCGLILTTGGTGIAERDVTPEAIRAIMRVELPGFGEVMR